MTEIFLGSLLLTALVLVLALLVIAARSVLMPARPVTLTINGATRIETHTGAKLLGALNDNGVLVPSACAGAGTCGLCRVKVLSGGGPAVPTEASRLTKSEMRDGVHLACQVTVRTAMAIEVPQDLIGAEEFECKVESVRPLAPLIREVVLQLPPGMRPDIEAGSFVQVTAPPYRLSYRDYDVPVAHEPSWKTIRSLSVQSDEPVTRAYSVANRPEDTAAGRIVLNIRLALPPPSSPEVSPGIVSSWLFGLAPGDRVIASGPFGSFRAQETGAEMVVIGGGVGMAPLRAIIHDQLSRTVSDRAISYWYGARSLSELFYADEFAALEKAHPNFRWTVVLSDPQAEDNWTGATGFVHSVVFQEYLAQHPAPEACEYYLCGPPLMIRAVKAMLADAGVEDDHVFADDFGV